MILVSTEFHDWNDGLFQQLIDFKKEIQSNIPTYFPEILDEYKKLLHKDSPFMKDSMLSHTAIIGRELMLLTLCRLNSATQHRKTGDNLRINVTTGEVEILLF